MNENQVHEQILQGQVARPVRLDGPAPTPPEPAAIDVSVVTGTLNRLSVLKPCIESVRNNGFKGSLEIIFAGIDTLSEGRSLACGKRTHKAQKAGQSALAPKVLHFNRVQLRRRLRKLQGVAGFGDDEA